jgi:hypothetical protein
MLFLFGYKNRFKTPLCIAMVDDGDYEDIERLKTFYGKAYHGLQVIEAATADEARGLVDPAPAVERVGSCPNALLNHRSQQDTR